MTTEDTMMNPAIESLMGHTGSKFSLVTLSARRAREINSYFNQLGDGLGNMVPPQVSSTARKPLSISFEEIAAGKIQLVAKTIEEVLAENEAALAAEKQAELDAMQDSTTVIIRCRFYGVGIFTRLPPAIDEKIFIYFRKCDRGSPRQDGRSGF
ncbi:MAG: DNA-directed polymerase subunit omega [Actinomycetota bacterium]